MQKIPINQLKTCSINAEIYRDSNVEDLINSIQEVGLLQKIVVTTDNLIVSGHRRLKALKILGWTEVECEVKEIGEDDLAITLVLYNQHRTKVASELLNEIKVLYEKLWVGRGKNKGIGGRNPNIRDVVANKVGISSSKIQQLLYIEENQPELLKLIDEEKITINGAYYEVKKYLNIISLSEYKYEKKIDPLNIEDLTIYNKSCENMGEIPDKTIQTIITSPPYYKKRNYSQASQLGIEKTPDEYLHRLLSVMQECKRVLKDNGCLFLVIGDSYDDRGCLRQIPEQVSLAMARENWILRNKLVRFATNAKPECSKVRRWSCSHEFIYFFTKSMDYFFDMDQIRVPYTTEFASSLTAGTPKHHNINESIKIQKQQSYIRHPLGAVPKDVIQLTLNQKADKYVPDPRLEHSAQFPEKLIKPFVLGTSRPGDVILDPFMGSGTTAKVSLDLGRSCVGYEINPHFLDTTYLRCARSGTTGKIPNEEKEEGKEEKTNNPTLLIQRV